VAAGKALRAYPPLSLPLPRATINNVAQGSPRNNDDLVKIEIRRALRPDDTRESGRRSRWPIDPYPETCAEMQEFGPESGSLSQGENPNTWNISGHDVQHVKRLDHCQNGIILFSRGP
jgi:hypothetical protein